MQSNPWHPTLLGAAVCALALGAGPATRAAHSEEPQALPEARWRVFQTGALRADRLQHASLAFSLGLGTGIVSERPEAAFAAGAVLGLAKEFIDVRSSHFDWVDLAADLVGAGLGALASRSLLR